MANRGPLRARRQQPSISSAASAHLRHLQQVAVWASTAVPPLGAFLGSRLASTSELFGCPPPSAPHFTCERCESILQVGVNCSVRVRTRKLKKRGAATKGVLTPINNVVYTCQYCAFESNLTGTPKHYVKTKLREMAARRRVSDEPHQSLNDSKQGKASKPMESNGMELLASPKGVSIQNSGKKTKRKGWLSLKQLAASSADLSPASSRPIFSLGLAILSHSGPTINASLLGMKADENATTYSSSFKSIVEVDTPLNDTERVGEKVSDFFVDESELGNSKLATEDSDTVEAVLSMRRLCSDDPIVTEENMCKPGMKADGNATANSRSFITTMDTDVSLMMKNDTECVDEQVLDCSLNEMEMADKEIAAAVLLKKRPHDDADDGWCKVLKEENVCIPATDRVSVYQGERKEASGVVPLKDAETICRNMNSQSLAQERKVKSRTEKKTLKVKSRTKKQPLFRRVGRHWLTCRKSKSPFEWRII